MTMCIPDSAIWDKPIAPGGADAPTLAKLALHIEMSEAFAWRTLQMLTGYALSICPVVVRPCRKACSAGRYRVAALTGSPFYPMIMADGQWTNIWCGHHDDCGCSEIQQITLPGPIGRIDKVQVDGVTLPDTAYRVDNGNKLVRVDGEAWPVCQDMNKPDDQPGTFSVSYMRGVAPDRDIDYAAGLLAAEFYKGMSGLKCKLPSGVTTIARQGITYEVQANAFQNGSTGIREVDIIIRSLNPHNLTTGPRVLSPDTMRSRGRQTTAGRR